jgi:hypothetical protein
VPYRIKERQRQAAKRLNVAIRPSSDKNKKLDVYKNGFLIARIGAAGYGDYASYQQEEKKGAVAPGTADKRRELYLIRMPTTPLKWELQAITPLKSSGRELF